MKFKKYIKESKAPEQKLTLVINEDFSNETSSVVADELDNFYAPVEKLISEGRFDEARTEIAALEKDLAEFEQENSKKKFFKFPQFMIDGQKKRLAELKSKLPVTESIDDMDKRCEKCNTLLNDAGNCPKCDDGEEDYGDELKEELSNKEKLLRAYPELNFDKEVVSEDVESELSNKEKLMRAFPGVFNFDNTDLNEGMGADTTHALRDAMETLAKDNKHEWANTVAEIANVIPDDFADNMFDAIKEKFANIRISTADKKKIVDASEGTVSDESVENADTIGDILDALDVMKWAENNPDLIKGLFLVILMIVAVLEPGPVIEVIIGIVSIAPASVVAKIAAILGVVSSPVSAAITVANKIHDNKIEEELSVREKLKAAYPELNFDEKSVDEGLLTPVTNLIKAVTEDTETPEEEEAEVEVEDSWYDDNYDFEEDDVELDRRHAALYGGDRMYCDCGHKLAYDEYGSYCPECNPHEPEAVYNESAESSCSYRAKECSYDMAYEIAQLARKALRLPAHEADMLEHDINNLRSDEWVEQFERLSDSSREKQLFFQYAVECNNEDMEEGFLSNALGSVVGTVIGNKLSEESESFDYDDDVNA